VTSRRRLGVLALAAAATIPLLAGCDLGHPGGFVARSNSYCAGSTKQISALKTPATPKEQLQYATDRYAIVEHLVSVMTDSSLPGGTDGSTLDDDWLRPARASLTEGRSVLADLRTAVDRKNGADASAEFGQSLAIGTQNVDTGVLRSRGLADCAKVFEPTSKPT
jgi:hypothetical protein